MHAIFWPWPVFCGSCIDIVSVIYFNWTSLNFNWRLNSACIMCLQIFYRFRLLNLMLYYCMIVLSQLIALKKSIRNKSSKNSCYRELWSPDSSGSSSAQGEIDQGNQEVIRKYASFSSRVRAKLNRKIYIVF